MNKEQIIEALLYRMSDPCVPDCDEDIAESDLMTHEEAVGYIAELREEDEDIGDDDYHVPAEATPELYMEAYNCRVKLARRNVTIDRIAEFITENNEVAMYSGYSGDLLDEGYTTNNVDVIPVDFLDNETEFFFDSDLSALDMILIGKNSKAFNADRYEYCWYDVDKKVLHGSHNPFEEDVLDAKELATYLVDHPDEITSGFVGYCDDEELSHIFEYMPELRGDC